jgi:hypothetical protein
METITKTKELVSEKILNAAVVITLMSSVVLQYGKYLQQQLLP